MKPKLKLLITNSVTHIQGYANLDKRVKEAAVRTLSYFSPSAKYSMAFKRGYWDGRVKCLSSDGKFPTGLLYRLAKDFDLRMEDTRVRPGPMYDFTWQGPELRDYQAEILDATEDYFRGIYEIPTRTGKTYVSAAIIEKYKQRSLLVVNSAESMKEAAEVLSQCIGGAKVGILGGGKNIDGNVVVAMMQTLCKKPELIKDFGLFIVDEVHLAAAETWYNTLLKSEAYWRYGQSGTVFREDNADIRFYANTGPLFYHIPLTQMWENDVVMKPEIKWVKFRAPMLHGGINYANVYQLGIVENEARNQEVLALVKKLQKESTMVSVESINHLNILSKLFSDNAIPHVVIHGEAENRDSDYQDFKSGKVKVAIASRVLNTSVTLPDLAHLVNAAGKKSEVELTQKLGRILGKGNKVRVCYYDFVDAHSKILMKHSMMRYRALKAAGHEQEGW